MDLTTISYSNQTNKVLPFLPVFFFFTGRKNYNLLKIELFYTACSFSILLVFFGINIPEN